MNTSTAQPHPSLGLDLDGVITDAPTFFSAWTHSWKGKVIIITYRKDREKAIRDLDERLIRYDEVILVDRFEAKAEVIREKKISIYIDDQPEMLRNIGPNVHVMLFRNEGNYDFGIRRWMMSKDTGVIVT
jgi:uncharacterized HAD superfamily protein